MTKVTIISGFLGAGKTTFIRKLIEEVYAGEKIVLIENEYGEIGIDGSFLKDAGIQITEMNSGCICCTLVGDFTEALHQVVETYAPERIIIEPSGVGKLSDIVSAVERVKNVVPDLAVTERITVVDVKKAKVYLKNFGEFFKNQVESASTLVLSRTQEVDDEKLEATTALLRGLNADAPMITTPWTELKKAAVLHALERSDGSDLSLLDLDLDDDEDEEEHEHHHHHHHHHHHGEHDADEVFTSWGRETSRKYTQEELDHILGELKESSAYGTILRAKGIVAMADGGWKQFDLVPEESETRDSHPDYTGRLCVIGCELAENKLAELFGLQE